MQRATHLWRWVPAIALAAISAGVLAPAAGAQTVIMHFAAGSTAESRANAAAELGGRVERDLPQLHAAVVEVGTSRATRTARAVSARSTSSATAQVVSTQPDTKMRIAWDPTDPGLSSQWHVDAISARAAWDTTRGSGVLVAVVDTGVDDDHPDLEGRILAGKDYVDGDGDPDDGQGHGTHVAGIVVAAAENGEGGVGIAPEAQVIAYRALDGNGEGYVSDIAQGVVDGADAGAKVINLSLGGGQADATLAKAIRYANGKGAVVTCATGNESARALGYPALYNGCLAVGASGPSNAHASFSNVGTNIDIAAPGVGIYSTTPFGLYESWDGTSMATPVVSGVAALLFAQGRSRTNVIGALTRTATDAGRSGWDQQFGWGIVNAAAAVAAPSDMVEAGLVSVSLGRCGSTPSARCKLRRSAKLNVKGTFSATTSSARVQLVFSRQQRGRFVKRFAVNVTPSATGAFTARVPLKARAGTWRVQVASVASWSNQSTLSGQAYFQVR